MKIQFPLKKRKVSSLLPLLILVLGAIPAVLILAPSPPQAAAESLNSWTASTSYPESTYASCVTDRGYVYCVSSFSSNTVYYAQLTSSGVGKWKATTSYPTNIAGESCVSSSGYIYCISGINGTLGPRPTTAVYYAPLSPSGVGAWTQTTSYPIGMIGLSCAAFSGYVYCVGGAQTVGTHQSTNVYYAPISSSGAGEWSSTTSYPETVNAHSCVATGGFIYCIAGFTASGPQAINSTYYAPVSSSGVGAWTASTAYPFKDQGLSCVTISTYIYCIGQGSSVYYAKLGSSGIGTWTSTASYPISLSGTSCIAQTSTIVCVAGVASGSPTDAVYYTLVGETTTTIKHGTSTLSVITQDQYGNTITDYYTVLYKSGSVVAAGFTPVSFTLDNGSPYSVQVQSFGPCQFDHWGHTGDTKPYKNVAISHDTQLVAVMDCST